MAENTTFLGKITKFLIIGGAIFLFILIAILVVKWVPQAIKGITNIGSSVVEETEDFEFEDTFEDDSREYLDEEPSPSNSVVDSEPIKNDSAEIIKQNHETVVRIPTLADLQISNVRNLGNSSFNFIVRNIGGQPTGNWLFTYTDAINPERIIYSPLQISLGSGQGLLITVQFDGQKNSSEFIQINIDPTHSVSESNEWNNSSSVLITGSNYGHDRYDRYNDADFVIDNLEVGRITNSRFIRDDEIDENDDVAIRFIVRNQGGETTDDWKFEVKNTPYDTNQTFKSKRQEPLKPGETREIIVEFENPDEGRYNVKVEIDSEDDTNEENERNNTKSKRLEVED